MPHMDSCGITEITIRLIYKFLLLLKRIASLFLMKEKIELSPWVVRTLYVGTALAACLLLALKIRGALVIPIAEVREMSNIIAIQSIRDGSMFQPESYPDTIYLYGILQAWILSHLSPTIDLLFANRFFALGCLLLSSAVLILAIKTGLKLAGRSLSWPLALLLFIASLAPHFKDMPLTLGTPNYLGLLCSNLVLLLCLKKRLSNLMLLPLLVTAAFMTKQYFLFSYCYIVLAYAYLYEGRVKWLGLALITLLIAAGLRMCFEISQTQYAFQHHLNMRGCKSLSAMVNKFCVFAIMTLPALWLLFRCLLKRGVQDCCCQTTREGRAQLTLTFHPLFSEKRGVATQLIIFGLAGTLAATLVMLRMGQHTGAISIIYYAQLLTAPFLFLTGLAAGMSHLSRRDYGIAGLLAGLLCLGLSAHDIRNYQRHIAYKAGAEIVRKDLADPGLVVRGCTLTSYMQRDMRLPINDNGQCQYMETTYPRNAGSGTPVCQARALEYKAQLADDIRKQRFDVIYTDEYSYLNSKNIPDLEKYYKSTGMIQIMRRRSAERWVKRTEPVKSRD